MRRRPTPAKQQPVGSRRRAVVLIAVLIAVTLLSLAAYQYSDLMTSEYRAADNAHRAAQAHAWANSGIWFTAAALSNADYMQNQLRGNIWNNDLFNSYSFPVDDNFGMRGYFTLIAPPDPTSGSQTVRYGVIDEGAKININVLMQLDPSGNRLYNALLQLPNMDPSVAAAIVDWVDADSNTRDGGAEDDYYTSQNPPYHCKNGPLESIEELLLVKGVTWQMLFGRDRNRNGVIDTEEMSLSADSDFGWAPFLTIYSREANSDASGNPFLFLNDSDIQTLYTNLSSQIDDNLAKFIILVRQYGDATAQAQQAAAAAAAAAAAGNNNNSNTASTTTPATGNKTPTTTTPATGNKTPATTTPASGNKTNPGASTTDPSGNPAMAGDVSSVTLDFTKQAGSKINSLWQLVNATVVIPATGQGQLPTVYTSPLADQSNQANLLPKVFGLTTVTQGNEIPARINVNTAPFEVLSTIAELSLDNVNAIMTMRPNLSDASSADPIFQTPAWLLTQAKLDPTLLQSVEQYITTKTQVYRIQSVGYLDESGASARIEAIIDTNGGRPRLLMYRDLTPLGKGWSNQQ